MRILWKREWLHHRRELCARLFMELICILAVFIIYKLKKSLLFKAVAYVMALPEEVYAFLGLPSGVVTGNISFYIQFVLMLLNVWIAWSFSSNVIHSIWREERNGSIYTICNQWCGRKQLVLAKYTWSILSFAAGYVLLYAVSSVLIISGSINHAQMLTYAGHMMGMMIRGAAVIIFIISICSCYAMCVRSKRYSAFPGRLIIGTLIIGNIYKVRDLLLLLARRAEINTQSAEAFMGWMDRLYLISPLSWINPYIEFPAGVIILQLVISIVLSALVLLCGCKKYQVRSF